MSTTPQVSDEAANFLPPVVVEALTHLRRYAAGGLRCRCHGTDVEVIEYVPRREFALELVDALEDALAATSNLTRPCGHGAVSRALAVAS